MHVVRNFNLGRPPPSLALTKKPYPFVTAVGGFTIQAIPRAMLPPPSEVLRMSADGFYGPTNTASDEPASTPKIAANYFAAWALVHYLMGPNGEASRRFREFLNIVTTTSVVAAWERAFAGFEARELDRGFHEYLDAGKLTLSAVPYRAPTGSRRLTKAPLNDGEKHVLLAKLTLSRTRGGQVPPEFLQEVEAAIRSAPPPAEGYYLRGMSAYSRGQHASAERDFSTALRLDADNPRALRASLELRLHQPYDSLVASEQTKLRADIERLERVATSPVGLLFAAHCFLRVGDQPRALALGSAAVARAPVDPLALSLYARLLASSGQLEQAIDTQRRALDFLHENRELRRVFQEDLARMESRK